MSEADDAFDNPWDAVRYFVSFWMILGGVIVALWAYEPEGYREYVFQNDCKTNYYLVAAVFLYRGEHPCGNFIDEYYWYETNGVGWHPDLWIECEGFNLGAGVHRHLNCTRPGEAPGVDPVPSIFAWPLDRPWQGSLTRGVPAYCGPVWCDGVAVDRGGGQP